MTAQGDLFGGAPPPPPPPVVVAAGQTLRPYQEQAVRAAREAYRQGHRSILLVCATGGGKTRIAVEFVTTATTKGGSVLWLAHRDELIKQARDRLMAEGLPRVGVIQAGEPTINAPVQVASIQTLVARAAKGLPPAKVVVFDEAHHYAAERWGQVANHYLGSAKLGLTATPERGDGLGLGELFDHLVPVSSVRELQALGVLVPCRTYAPEARCKQLSQDPVAAYLARTPGERCFCFTKDVDAAEVLVERFVAAGVPAATIHESTPWALRRARLEAFRHQTQAPLLEAGTIEPAPLVLANCFTLTEGVDVPEASCCLLARGCNHHGMFLQMVGRVLRAAANKDHATLLDLCGVVHKLGLPEDDREWHLEGKACKNKGKDREAKPKACPRCSAMVRGWTTDSAGWRICPLCRQRVLPPEPPEIAPRPLRAMGNAAPQKDRDEHLRRLAKVAVSKGRKAGWIAYAYKDRFGTFPPFGAAKQAYLDAGGTAA